MEPRCACVLDVRLSVKVPKTILSLLEAEHGNIHYLQTFIYK